MRMLELVKHYLTDHKNQTWSNGKHFLVMHDFYGPTGLVNNKAFATKSRSLNETDDAASVAESIYKTDDWVAFYTYDPNNRVIRYASGKFIDLAMPLVNL